jgi:hypothetical protein
MNRDQPPERSDRERQIDGLERFFVSFEADRKRTNTSAVSQQGSWEVIGAVMGRGTFLVGESPRNPHGEALVLVPPGVRISAAAGSGEQVSTEGWRVALWPSDEEGNLHVDVGRPSWVTEVSLAYVIGFVELECPAHLSWVADRLERQLLNAQLVQMPDEEGSVFGFAESWKQEAEGALQELDAALTANADPAPESGDGDFEQLMPDLGTAFPRDPGKHEARLAPGWMRQFYSGLAASGRLP